MSQRLSVAVLGVFKTSEYFDTTEFALIPILVSVSVHHLLSPGRDFLCNVFKSLYDGC